jgi:DNA-binding MarR family transcriptional regulator
MSTATTLTGQDIGQAENAVRAVLDAYLDQMGVTFHKWVVMNALGKVGKALEQERVVQQMTAGLKIGEPAVFATIDEVTEMGLIANSSDPPGLIELTPAGAAAFQRLRSGVDDITRRLYGDLPADDLATAHRVLAIVTERANAELAS